MAFNRRIVLEDSEIQSAPEPTSVAVAWSDFTGTNVAAVIHHGEIFRNTENIVAIVSNHPRLHEQFVVMAVHVADLLTFVDGRVQQFDDEFIRYADEIWVAPDVAVNLTRKFLEGYRYGIFRTSNSSVLGGYYVNKYRTPYKELPLLVRSNVPSGLLWIVRQAESFSAPFVPAPDMAL